MRGICPAMNPHFDTRVLQTADTRIRECISQHETELGNGTQIVADDAAATGMKAARHMGIIRGLNLALQLMEGVHKEMTGKAKKD